MPPWTWWSAVDGISLSESWLWSPLTERSGVRYYQPPWLAGIFNTHTPANMEPTSPFFCIQFPMTNMLMRWGGYICSVWRLNVWGCVRSQASCCLSSNITHMIPHGCWLSRSVLGAITVNMLNWESCRKDHSKPCILSLLVKRTSSVLGKKVSLKM